MPALAAFKDHLQSVLDDTLARRGVPGAVVGIRVGGEQLIVASGVANAATAVETTPDTIFQIGSISKVYTATLVMQLVHAGLVELDEPVRGALQEFRVRDEVSTLTITPRHLLSHTSGIEGDHFLDCGRNPDALWRYVSTLDDLGQIHAPDDMYSYCNTGFGVLGRLVEEVTGDHYTRALHRRLLRPLRTERTFTLAEQAIIHRVAAGHRHTVGAPAEVQPWTLARFSAPIGGVLADAGDLLRFAALHLDEGKTEDGRQVLPAKATMAMREGQVDVPGTPDERGLGFALLHWPDTEVIGHDGDTIGQRAFLRIFPEHDAAVVVLANSPLGDHVADAALTLIARELLHVQAPPKPVPLGPDEGPDPDRCTGVYERLHQRLALAGDGDGSIRMTIIPDDLFLLAGARERTLTLHPVDETTYVLTDPDTGVSATVAMVGDEERPDFVHYGGRAHRRIS